MDALILCPRKKTFDAQKQENERRQVLNKKG